MPVHYTLVVGTKNWSSWSLRPYMALRHIGVPFDEQVVALRRDTTSAEIRKRSASGRVPLLEIAAGGQRCSVWDSLAICETLAERHPEAGLLPEGFRARCLARSYSAEMHSGFPDLREQLTMEYARTLPAPPLREATRAQIARILSAWNDALAEFGGDGGFLFGRFSIADCMYAPVISRFRTYGVELPPIAASYCERMLALPAMIDWGRDAKSEIETGLA